MAEALRELPHYIGNDIPNCDYTHGQIMPFPGVKSYQLVRANRSVPEEADNTPTAYKHAPDIAVFNNRIYVQYLVNNKDEHEPGGYSILACSDSLNGKWEFKTTFPPYRIPKCRIEDYKGLVHEFTGDSYGFMHQRMSFYMSSSKRMLLLGFYGWSPEKWMTNWDNYGIGRVVREIYPDGSLSDIYFIRPNYQAGWSDELLNYPLYSKAPDSGFVEACNELLDDRLYTQQWAEENGDADDIITVKHPAGGTNQAFCWYHIDRNRVIGLWKHSKVASSCDGGRSRSEVPMKRYQGFWKDFGPQYMRGITEGILERTEEGNRRLTFKNNGNLYVRTTDDVAVCSFEPGQVLKSGSGLQGLLCYDNC